MLPIVPRVLSVSWVGKRVSEKRAWALGRANEPLPPVSAQSRAFQASAHAVHPNLKVLNPCECVPGPLQMHLVGLPAPCRTAQICQPENMLPIQSHTPMNGTCTSVHCLMKRSKITAKPGRSRTCFSPEPSTKAIYDRQLCSSCQKIRRSESSESLNLYCMASRLGMSNLLFFLYPCFHWFLNPPTASPKVPPCPQAEKRCRKADAKRPMGTVKTPTPSNMINACTALPWPEHVRQPRNHTRRMGSLVMGGGGGLKIGCNRG